MATDAARFMVCAAGIALKVVVELVNAQMPDLVAITGDFVSYVLEEIAGDMVASLRQLVPRDATVAVLGNHDHWLGATAVRHLLRASEVIDLSNDVFTLQRQAAMLMPKSS